MAGNVEELSFKVEQAKEWKKDVEAEIQQVSQILDLVAEEVKTTPFEDDTILCGLKATGEALGKSFKVLNKNFTAAVEGIEDIVTKWTNMISKALEGIAEITRKIGGQ